MSREELDGTIQEHLTMLEHGLISDQEFDYWFFYVANLLHFGDYKR